MNLNAKVIRNHLYFHISQLDRLQQEEKAKLGQCISLAKVEPTDFNVVRLDTHKNSLSLLFYPGFDNEAFPALLDSWTIDLDAMSFRYRTYEDSLNPPILHRKELLIANDDPRLPCFTALTDSATQIGLFDNPNRIGFKRSWEALLLERGYAVSGHELIPIGNDVSTYQTNSLENENRVARHLTALTRHGFSAPIQTLARFGFLDGSKSVFDYGCGRGDDVRGLRENNIVASGWDPYFAPKELKNRAHIVNIGFVVNVIEDLDERIEALNGAYALCDEMLVVSSMLANQDAIKGRPYGDGVLTSRNTFQKYFTQNELRQFIVDTLDVEPIPVGPGIFYVFKNKDVEQRFRYGRLENKRNLLRLSQLSRPEKIPRVSRSAEKYERYRDQLEKLWELCLSLGRYPDRSEINNHEDISNAFGSLNSALRFIMAHKENGEQILESARASRISDLVVYFAQLQFEKRPPYSHLESRLQRDIRSFFGDYKTALIRGKELLFSLGSIDAIDAACRTASEHGVGWLDEDSLQLHTSMVEQLPPVLRTYVTCGTLLYGDVTDADLIKIHIRSGKLTLMKYDDFSGRPLPKMLQRIKLNLRRQDFDVFDYGELYEPPYLYRKSRFINEEFPNYSEQIRFEETLEGVIPLNLDGYGPSADVLDEALKTNRYQIEGFQLIRSRTDPDLDAICGKYFTYRDFIECGETQKQTGLKNLPKSPDSYTALFELARNVIDPVVEYFGMIRLTYGFCSSELSKHISGRVAPKLDQHASCELNRLGKPICERGGAAVDFMVEDENMLEVAKWISENTTFDRMYIYGPDRPIHVSYSHPPLGQITLMLSNDSSGSRVPKVVKQIHLELLHQMNFSTR